MISHTLLNIEEDKKVMKESNNLQIQVSFLTLFAQSLGLYICYHLYYACSIYHYHCLITILCQKYHITICSQFGLPSGTNFARKRTVNRASTNGTKVGQNLKMANFDET